MNTTKTTKTTKGKEDKFSRIVIGCAIEVHRTLGPGLLESTYEQCLAHEFALAKVPFKIQVPMPIRYKNVSLDCGYRLDFLIDDHLILELKVVEKLLKIHRAQILTYMKLASADLGLLINFNTTPLVEGIERLIL